MADQEVLYSLELVMCKQKDQKQSEHCINYNPLRRKTKNTAVIKMYKTAGEVFEGTRLKMTVNGAENGESQEKETTQTKNTKMPVILCPPPLCEHQIDASAEC
jgi:hypothetical protein